jgi:hypothetical protein
VIALVKHLEGTTALLEKISKYAPKMSDKLRQTNDDAFGIL